MFYRVEKTPRSGKDGLNRNVNTISRHSMAPNVSSFSSNSTHTKKQSIPYKQLSDKIVSFLIGVGYGTDLSLWHDFTTERQKHLISLLYTYLNSADMEPVHTITSNTFCAVRAQILIHKPPYMVYPHLVNFELRKEWDLTFTSGKRIYTFDNDHDLQRHVYHTPHHKPRDFCLLSSRRRYNDGCFVIVFRSIVSDLIPVESGHDRATAKVQGFTLQRTEAGHCILTAVSVVDEKGEMAMTDDILGLSDGLGNKFIGLCQIIEESPVDIYEMDKMMMMDNEERKVE